MFDVALGSAGAQVSLCTSCDEKYPPENMIDGNAETFWVSTGLYPQEFIITFQSLMNINTIKVDCNNVRRLQVERSVQNDPTDFEPLQEKDLEPNDGQLQSEEFSVQNTTATHLKFSIPAASDHFISVHKIHVDGNAVH